MAQVILTFKIMPESPDVDLEKLSATITDKISAFAQTEPKIEKHPVAFGLNALHFIFVMDESKGSTDSLEDDIKTLEEVSSCEVIDVRRAIG